MGALGMNQEKMLSLCSNRDWTLTPTAPPSLNTTRLAIAVLRQAGRSTSFDNPLN